MKPTLVIGDLHLGVRRVAGTTPQSQLELRQHLHKQFDDLIFQHLDKDLIINGDLMDAFEVDINDVLICYLTLNRWMEGRDNNLVLSAGNHDSGKRNDKLSSFGLLAQLLENRYTDRVHIVDRELVSFPGDVHIIPHMLNQDLFNIELEKALQAAPGYLLLHANVDNGFAENSDHSLNVDGEWLTKLSRKHTVIFSHEHAHRVVKYGHKPIFVLGNPFPSSISDCLAQGEAQGDGCKFAHVLHPDGTIEPIKTWERSSDFVQLEWTSLEDTPAKFIRVTGTATADQAADVISAIAHYRTRSNAYVITNGVKIEGVGGMGDLAEMSFESIKAFDVLAALYELLEPEEAAAIRTLMGDEAPSTASGGASTFELEMMS